MLTYSVDKAPGWIPSLPLPKKWHKAALCFSASRRGQLLCFGCFILLGGEYRKNPCQRSSRASCHLKVGADNGVELSVLARHGGLLQFSYKHQVLLMFIPVGAAEVGVPLKWLCSVSSPCWDTGFSAHLAVDRTEKGWLVILQDGLEGRVRWTDAATVTSSLL